MTATVVDVAGRTVRVTAGRDDPGVWLEVGPDCYGGRIVTLLFDDRAAAELVLAVSNARVEARHG